jgi:hypothetical protein
MFSELVTGDFESNPKKDRTNFSTFTGISNTPTKPFACFAQLPILVKDSGELGLKYFTKDVAEEVNFIAFLTSEASSIESLYTAHALDEFTAKAITFPLFCIFFKTA